MHFLERDFSLEISDMKSQSQFNISEHRLKINYEHDWTGVKWRFEQNSKIV